METASAFDYKKFRSQISLQYGVELDETSLAILRIILIQQVNSFNTQNKKLDEAIKHINQSKKSLEVSKEYPKSQAFWFGMGKVGLPIAIVTLIAGICLIYQQYIKSQEKIVIENVEWYKAYYKISSMNNPRRTADFLKNFPPPK